jgi:hypothetical protein
MESLRQYVTDGDLQERGIATPELFKTIQAERDIDTVIKNFYEKVQRKFLIGVQSYTDAVFTTTQVTLNNTTYDSGYFTFTALELLSGVNKGKQIALDSSVSSNGQTVIQFKETQTITPGTYNCKIWQEGKFPRFDDTSLQDLAYSKSIPNWLQDCVAYQYLFRENNAQLFNLGYPLKSYSVDRAQYREDYATDSNYAFTIENRISPDALSILSDRGMLGRSS